MRRLWLAALAPIGLGAAFVALAQLGQLANPILYMRADAGTLTLLCGVVLSAVLALAFLVRRRLEQIGSRGISEARMQAAEERRRFLQRLDHELKNPVMAIRAGLANLEDMPAINSRVDTLGSISTQAMRLSRLTADLRKLAEMEAQALECAPVDVAELLNEVLTLAQERPDAAQRRLALSLPRAPWPLPAVAGDQDLLFLAAYNLVDNAIKFTQAGDTIEIRAYEDASTVAIEVADTGPGISEADIGHVWDELYRSRSAQGTPGSGLGLALVRAIVQRHGGQSSIRSRPGQGTVVTLRLPVSEG